MSSVTHTPIVIDSDAAPDKLPANRAVSMLNVTPERGYGTTAYGTIELPGQIVLPDGENIAVGKAVDFTGQSIIYWVWNENGDHRLVRYFKDTTITLVLLTAPLLQLGYYDEICHTGIIGDYLAWLDNDGVQYRLNMAVAGAGGYAGLAEPYFFRLARPVPMYPAGTIRRASAPGTNLVNRIGEHDWQIAYCYGYADNDVTVLSVSDVNRATAAGLSQDVLLVVLPLEEVPSNLVQRIEFFARKGNGVLWQKIKVLKRDSTGKFPIDPATGATPRISFSFLGQFLGETLDTQSAEKLFEAIPLRSKALAAAGNRFHLGNNVEGYAPTKVALTAQVENTTDTFVVETKEIYQVKIGYNLGEDNDIALEGYSQFLLISGTHGQSSARYVNHVPNPFLNVAFEVAGATVFTRAQLIDETKRLIGALTPGMYSGSGTIDQDGSYIGTISYVRLGVINKVKSHASYQMGLVYFDYAGHNSGTLTNDAAAFTSGDLNLATPVQYGSRFRWSLTTADAHAEIPEWAVAYAIVVLPCQTATAFQQLHVAQVLRLKKDAPLTKPEYVSIGNPGGRLWLDIYALTSPDTASGYVWSAESNDRVRIWEHSNSNTFYDYKIVGQVGTAILVDEPTPHVYDRVTRVEIYSPNEATNTIFYETGPRYPILRSPSGIRSYSATTGTLPGDVLLTTAVTPGLVSVVTAPAGDSDLRYLYRAGTNGMYYVIIASTGAVANQGFEPATIENEYYARTDGGGHTRNYSIPFAFTGADGTPPVTGGIGGVPGFFEVISTVPANNKNWLNDRGRPSTIIADGPPLPALRTISDRWGGVLLPGSRINGLSSFNDEDEVVLPQENGPITALVLANQQQSNGTVLVGWQHHGTASLYLGEAVLTQADGEPLRADSSKVVGTVRPLSGKRGTTHPASITAWDGVIWAWSQEHAEILRYDQSGITRLAKTFHGRALCRMLAKIYEGAKVSGGYDPTAETYYLTFQAVENHPAITVGFCEREEAKGFCGFYSFTPRVYASLSTFMYTFYNAVLHQHNIGAPRTTFYGVLYPAEVTILPNEYYEEQKEWLSLAFYGSDAWDASLIENEQAGGVVQRSRTKAAWAKWQQGAYVVALRRDELKPVMPTPGVTISDPAQLLHVGRPLQSPWLRITVRIMSNKVGVRLVAIKVNYNLLTGQQPVPKPA